MKDYLAPYRMLKEARKTWDYVITDKLVYGIQDSDVIVGGRRSGYVESYLKGHIWIEACFRVADGNARGRYYIYLIESSVQLEDNPLLSWNNQIRSGLGLDNESVIGFVRQLSDNGEKVRIRPMRSIVWLHPLNIWESGGQDVPILAFPFASEPISSVPNGELSSVIRFTRSSSVSQMLDCQFPSDVVQSSSQVTGEISNDRTPSIGNIRRPFEGDAFPSLLIFIDSPIDRCCAFLEFGDIPLDAAEVYLRPLSCEPSIIQWVGRRNHGQDSSTKTEDPQRATRFRFLQMQTCSRFSKTPQSL